MTSPKPLLAAFFYGAVIILNPFLMKTLNVQHGFKFPFFVLTIRMLVGLLTVEILRAASVLRLPSPSWERISGFLTASSFSFAHSLLAAMAIGGMSVPMYSALKQCTPIVNLVLTVIVLGNPPPKILVVVSVGIITLGSVIAGFRDPTFEAAAYLCCVGSVVALGFYQTLIQNATSKRRSTSDIFYINCINCLPLFFIGSLLTNELSAIPYSKFFSDSSFLMCFLITTVVGNLLNYSVFLCTAFNSALTTSLVSALKNIPQLIISHFLFGWVSFDPLNILGIILNCIGGVMFAFVKYKEQQQKRV